MKTEKNAQAAEKQSIKKWGRKIEAFATARRRNLRFDCALDEIEHSELCLMNEAARAAFESLLDMADSALLKRIGLSAFEYEEIATGEKLEKLANFVEGCLFFPVSDIWRQVWRGRLKKNMQRFRKCAGNTPDYLDLGE